jgi:hypothetical protein
MILLSRRLPAAVLDAPQLRQPLAALVGVRELQQERRLPVVPVRNQRVVGIQLLLDRVGFEDALDAQHLLHLVLHRQPVFERPGRVRADGDAAVALVLDHPGAEILARRRVLLEAHQVVAGEVHIP